jgi:poly-gamma-glutamate biosynthesis protein PgsC/CapC
MIVEALLIGLVLGMLFYEITDVSPGGVIAPGYFALFINQLDKIIVTLLISVIVFYIIKLLSGWLIIYGRRRLLLSILLGFCIKLIVEFWIQPLPIITIDLQSIGYIIPGLIANEMVRQKIIPTISSLGIVSISVYLLLQIFH